MRVRSEKVHPGVSAIHAGHNAQILREAGGKSGGTSIGIQGWANPESRPRFSFLSVP